MTAWYDATIGNPVFVKEMRVRMRGTRAFWILGSYLGLLGMILGVAYATWQGSMYRGISSGQVGQGLFAMVIGVQAFLATFITPALTAGAISIEREQRTLELLQVSRITRTAIVAGKLAAAYAFVALLIVASLPLASICFLLGGVSPAQVLQSYLMLLAASMLMGALGVAWSSVSSSTTAAIGLTYASMMLPGAAMVTVAPIMLIGANFMFTAPRFALCLKPAAAALGLPGSGGTPYAPVPWFGMVLPAWLPPTTVYVLVGVTLASLAAGRLEMDRFRRVGTLRAILASLYGSVMAFVFGSLFAPYWNNAHAVGGVLGRHEALAALIIPVFLLMLAAPAFTTGDVATDDVASLPRFAARGWTRAAWSRGTIASGLPYLLCLAALTLGVYALASSPAAPRFASYSMTHTAAAVWWAPRAAFCGIALVLIVSLVGFASLGLALSFITQNRWAALALSAAVVLAIMASPAFEYAPPGSPVRPLALFGLVNPLKAVTELSDPIAGNRLRTGGLLMMSRSASVCVVGHTGLTALALGVVALEARRRRRRTAPPVLRGARRKDPSP